VLPLSTTSTSSTIPRGTARTTSPIGSSSFKAGMTTVTRRLDHGLAGRGCFA
jgi:hypothetical protein